VAALHYSIITIHPVRSPAMRHTICPERTIDMRGCIGCSGHHALSLNNVDIKQQAGKMIAFFDIKIRVVLAVGNGCRELSFQYKRTDDEIFTRVIFNIQSYNFFALTFLKLREFYNLKLSYSIS